VNLTDIIDSEGNSILSSNVSLGDLFGVSGSGSAQGSNTDITDNYAFTTGKSKTDINRAIQTKAKTDAGTNGTATYTYYLNASDINAQLGLTGNNALPDGYRVRFTSDSVLKNDVLSQLKSGTMTNGDSISLYVEDAGGTVVAKGEATEITTATPVDADGDGTNDTSVTGVQWKFTDGKLDSNGNFVADQENGADKVSSYTLTKLMTLEDVTSQGTIVTSTDGITGYRFNVEDIRDQLNLDKTTYPDGSVVYYWPTFSAGQTITLSETGSQDKTFDSMVAMVQGSTVSKREPQPGKYEGIENLLEDYSYTTITGGQLATATSSTGQIFTEELPQDAEVRYNVFGGSYSIVTPSTDGFTLQFNTVDGTLTSVGGGTNTSQTLNLSKLTAAGYDGFQDVTIDFSSLLNYNNGGSNTAAMSGGDADSIGKGKKLGAMTGMTVDQSGKIYASYDNGNTVLLGQIAVAQFANASGLEALGDNCYGTTLNSGEFDGIGVEIDADGSSITSGELEMSNVDLATEFTSMITTQRGFQANSRVITTSDSMLEELINLKR
jgi:flagellar hook-basal body protein